MNNLNKVVYLQLYGRYCVSCDCITCMEDIMKCENIRYTVSDQQLRQLINKIVNHTTEILYDIGHTIDRNKRI